MDNKKRAGMTRRQFCGASMLGAICLANMDAVALAATKKQEEIDAEIVVIGGGGSGLMSAVGAVEAGIKDILVLEKAAQPGGNTTNVGVFFAVNSPVQKRSGITVTAEQAFKEKMAHDHWRQNARLIRDTIEKSGEIIQWLEDRGMKFEDIGSFAGGDAPRVGHQVKGPSGALGKAIIKMLSASCNEQGIRMLCETSAKKILTDKQGAVTGVLAAAKDKEIRIAARGVIIASGGFACSKELMKKYFPYNVDYKTSSLPQMTGDGSLMAEEIGAIVEDQLSVLLVGPVASESSPNINLHQRYDILAVNKEGERYFDESLRLHYNLDDISNTLSRQKGKEYYALLDSAIVRDAAREAPGGMGMQPGQDDPAKNNSGGAEIKADTWEEIAEFIGVDPKILKETIKRYNTFCERGYDSDFFKDPKYLRPINTPPYLAIRVRNSTNTTFGGIKINHRAEVLNRQDIPIKGLYAAGDCAGSWAPLTYSHRYPGSASSFALCSGLIAGKNVAKYISENRMLKG